MSEYPTCERCAEWSRKGLSDTCPACDLANQPAPPEAQGYHSRSEQRRLQTQGLPPPTNEVLASTEISNCLKCMRDTATRDGDCMECGLSKQSDLELDQNSASSNVARKDTDVDQAREWWISDERPWPPKVFVEKPDWAWPASTMLVHVIERSAYDALEARCEGLERERDAYKKAKAENDERFQLEAGRLREQAEALLEVARCASEVPDAEHGELCDVLAALGEIGGKGG